MSVVAAKVYADRVTMAADSIMTKGWSKTNNNFVKINEINDMIVGGCGLSQKARCLMRECFQSPRMKFATVLFGGSEMRRETASKQLGKPISAIKNLTEKVAI